jgi:hypothetical protein
VGCAYGVKTTQNMTTGAGAGLPTAAGESGVKHTISMKEIEVRLSNPQKNKYIRPSSAVGPRNRGVSHDVPGATKSNWSHYKNMHHDKISKNIERLNELKNRNWSQIDCSPRLLSTVKNL